MIVPDASVVAHALITDGPLGTMARSALDADDHWAAPQHLVVEVVSTIRGRVLGGKLRVRRGSDAVRALSELVIDWIAPQATVERIWELRNNLSAYDAAYVATAEALDVVLVTADARLAAAVGPRCEFHVLRPHSDRRN